MHVRRPNWVVKKHIIRGVSMDLYPNPSYTSHSCYTKVTTTLHRMLTVCNLTRSPTCDNFQKYIPGYVHVHYVHSRMRVTKPHSHTHFLSYDNVHSIQTCHIFPTATFSFIAYYVLLPYYGVINDDAYNAATVRRSRKQDVQIDMK